MTKTTKIEATMEPAPSLHFDFPKDSKMKVPDNFGDLDVDGKATVMAKGTVKSVAHDEYGRSFRMTPDKVVIKTVGEKPKTLQEAISENKEKRVA